MEDISRGTIEEMIRRGKVEIWGAVIKGDALEALNGAFTRGIRIEIGGSRIEGGLDFTRGSPQELWKPEIEGKITP